LAGRWQTLVVATDDALHLIAAETRQAIPWSSITALTLRYVVADGQTYPLHVQSDKGSYLSVCRRHLPFDVPKAVTPPLDTTPGSSPAEAEPDIPATPTPKFCGQCGAPLTPDLRFCGQCGQPVPTAPTAMPVTPPLGIPDANRPAAEKLPNEQSQPLPPVSPPPVPAHLVVPRTPDTSGELGRGLRIAVAAVVIGAVVWFGVSLIAGLKDHPLTLTHSDAYKRGAQIGNQYEALADQAEVTDTWTGETTGKDLRGGLEAWCSVEWQAQGITVGGLANTPKNKEDFIQGCVDAINEGK